MLYVVRFNVGSEFWTQLWTQLLSTKVCKGMHWVGLHASQMLDWSVHGEGPFDEVIKDFTGVNEHVWHARIA